MIKIMFSSLVLFLVVASASTQPFIISGKLENRWRWTPATGNPDHYIIEKYSQGKWTTDSQVPATPEQDGFVYATIISPDVEIYKIRVIAVDAAGNQSSPSPESDFLLVFPQAGRPIFVE